jgi:phospholipid-binding lipoprotein MlaA
MRSNGFRLTLLSALLAPVAAFAQTAAPEAAAPATGETTEAAAVAPATTEAGAAIETMAADAAPTISPEPAAATSNDEVSVTQEAAIAQEAAGQEPPPAGMTQAEGETPTDANAQTEAEQAFGDIYGTQEFADPTLPAAAVLPGTYDPWEGYNRRMHRLNNAVDRRVARPLARGYVRAVPRPVRLGVSNFFNNLGQPLTMVNSLLQGKPKQAGQSLGRFLLNSTFGIGGIFDPASRANLPQKSEDFGQTLGVWGWKRSRYFELPLFGPRTVRDVFGMAGDAPLSPLRQVEADRVRVPLQGVQLVDVRAQLLSTDSLREGAEDDYALVRDAWSQRRDYQIFGDRRSNDGSDLPDYLRDDDESIVPVDAMPVLRPDGN